MNAQTTLFALAALLFATGTAPSQEKQPPPIRIGAINYGAVFTNYDKAKDFKKELESAIEPLKAEADKIKAQLTELKATAENPKTTPDAAAFTSTQIRERMSRLEELDKSARQLVGDRQKQQIVEIWVDVKKAVAEQAQKNDLDIVLAYGDAPGSDPDTFTNITRKMGGMDAGGTVPVYIRNGAEITSDVTARLNAAYQARKKSNVKPMERAK